MNLQYGIIGCGDISRFHFGGLKKIGARIAHVADVDAERGKRCAEKYGAKFSTNYRELLDNPAVSVVSVLTPENLHKQMCIDAINAGKDVICEKTLAKNLAESYEIAKAVQKSNKLFFIGYTKRFFPAVKKAKELLSSLGKIFSAHARTYQPYGHLFDSNDASPYQEILDQHGGCVVKCAGSHIIDLILFFCGRPKNVYAYMDYISNSKVDRKATALFEYPSGLVVNFETAFHPLKRIGYERNSWDERIEINGTNGRVDIFIVKWDKPDNNPVLLVHYDNTAETSAEYRFDAVNPFDMEMEYFHECLSGKKQGNPDVIDACNVEVLIAAMGESHEKKRSIPIDWNGLQRKDT